MDKFVRAFEDRHSITLGSSHNPFFDHIADQYEDARPGYPDGLYDDLAKFFPRGASGELLEIGAGNGIATAELATRVNRVVAIEPGGALLAQAVENCKNQKNIDFENSSFEDFDRTRTFDAVVAFTSFHWVRSEQRFLQVANHLKEGGIFAACWNSYMPPMGEAGLALSALISQATQSGQPNSSKREVIKRSLQKLSFREKELLQQEHLSILLSKRYISKLDYPPKRYIALLDTFPNISSLADPKKISLYNSIIDFLRDENVTIPVISSLTVLMRVEDQVNNLI